MGYKDPANDIFVKELVGAGPNAVHEKEKFIPDGKFQQAALSLIYKKSKGHVTYLGDWHSHPERGAYMGELDISTIAKIAKTPSSREPNPIFVIIGTSPREVKCWRYQKEMKDCLEELEVKTS